MAESDWVDDPHESDWVDDPHTSALQAAVQHGINKATGGFSDELQGLGEAAGRVVGVKGAGGSMKDMGIAPGGPTLDWETLRDAYRAARDHERATLKQESNEHPIASGAGDVAGMVASPINKIAKGLSLAKAGATLGGINALGASDKEDLPGMAQDTAMGAGVGALTGGALQAAAPLASSAASGLKNTIEDVATAPLGQEGEKGLVAKGLSGIQQAGEKGNALLDKIGPKIGRYVMAPKIQAAADTLESAPGNIQAAAGKVATGLDKAQQFLMRSPRLQSLAQNSPKAFSAMAASLATRAGANAPATVVKNPNQPPVDEEQARQAFISGN